MGIELLLCGVFRVFPCWVQGFRDYGAPNELIKSCPLKNGWVCQLNTLYDCLPKISLPTGLFFSSFLLSFFQF